MDKQTCKEFININPPIKKQGKIYFPQLTEDAIVQYNNETDVILKNKLYSKYIQSAFEKLVENLIHTFKFYNYETTYDDLKHEVISFLIIKLDKYKQENGRAFGFFDTVAKRYLILRSMTKWNKDISFKSIDLYNDSDSSLQKYYNDEHIEDLKYCMNKFVMYMEDNFDNLFTTNVDRNVADSIIELIKNRNNIEEFNKKALYVLIKERSRSTTNQVTKIMNFIRNLYYEKSKDYYKM